MKIEKRRLGKTDMDVSVLGFGAAEIGFEGASVATVERLLKTALDAGLNIIDTAECYGNSEELLGKTVSGRRKDFHLFTKVGHPEGYSSQDWSGKGIERQIERSLKRLQVENVDLVQLHSCDKATLEKGEAIQALESAKKRGLVRYLGYSGDGEVAKWALESGKFDVLQTSVSIADQESLELLLPLAVKKKIGVIAKRPIANAAWRHGKTRPTNEYHLPYWERLQKLDYDFLASDKAVSTALRFAVFQPGVTTAIVGTTKPDRWLENAKLLEAGPLAAKDVEKIRARWKQIADASWVGQI